jgi:acyl carrier protein
MWYNAFVLEEIMTLDKVKKLVASQLSVAEEKITEESRLIEDLGADSLDIMEMLMALEDEFGISISDDETAKMKTIAGVVAVIDSKL